MNPAPLQLLAQALFCNALFLGLLVVGDTDQGSVQGPDEHSGAEPKAAARERRFEGAAGGESGGATEGP